MAESRRRRIFAAREDSEPERLRERSGRGLLGRRGATTPQPLGCGLGRAGSHTRWIGYPIAAAVAAVLVWAGFVRKVEPDYLTLLSAATIHAQLAAAIPGDTENVRGLEVRREEIRQAREWLARARRSEPEANESLQLEAFLAALEGRHREAARFYRDAREMQSCPAEVRPWLCVHEAKALSNAGDHAAAAALIAANAAALPEDVRVVARGVEARALLRAGRADEAVRIATELAGKAETDARAGVAAAEVFEVVGDWQAAEATWRATAGDSAVRDYHIARLKLRSGATDHALELLREAVGSGGPSVQRLLKGDAALWSTVCPIDDLLVARPAEGPAAPAAGR